MESQGELENNLEINKNETKTPTSYSVQQKQC